MSRVAEHPKKHVLSFRVSDAEWNLLKKATRKSGADVSTLLRQGLLAVLQDPRPD
jgi:hypothetical protein